MRSGLVGFGLGFLVALQLGPMSLLLIRSTLRGGTLRGGALRIADGLAGLGMLGFGGALAYSTIREQGV